MNDGIVIAGGGLAAQRASETLRREGYAGPLRMVCGEPRPPYDRPPLSKDVLSGVLAEDSVRFRSDAWYESHDVELLLGVSATSVRPSEQRVGLSDGTALRYTRLLVATGSRPRELQPLTGRENVSQLRTLDDARRLRDVLSPGVRLAVIGAGFIGMEVAATARKLGAEVTMIEAGSNPLVRMLGELLGNWFSALHRAEGVEVITNDAVTGVHGTRAVRSLRLSDDRTVETDHVVVGVGVQPDIEWLAGTRLCNGGVPVDVDGRTVLAGVFAAGDAAATYDERSRRHIPGSHWEAAGRQATRAARAMLGLNPGKPELTSFWTDQYGLRIQYLGHAQVADALTIDGELEQREFSATFTRAGRPVAALLVNRARSLPEMRRLIGDGASA